MDKEIPTRRVGIAKIKSWQPEISRVMGPVLHFILVRQKQRRKG